MNENHLQRFLYKTETWNEWRRQHPDIRPDLSRAVLNSSSTKSVLNRVNSIFNRFQERNYQNINLHNSDLQLAKISTCDLNGANFADADLRGAEIRGCKLQKADFREADLRKTQFLVSDLSGAHFDGAKFGKTYFGATHLTNVKGLEQAIHRSDSDIDQFSIIDSLPLSVSFLKACNVQTHTMRMAEWYIQNKQPYYRCFISYSRRDEAFVNYLREALTWFGVPSWFAPDDMRNKKLRPEDIELDRELFINVDVVERFLFIISPNILPSRYVTKEYQRADGKVAIIPILIEDTPTVNSSEWNALIAKRVKTEKAWTKKNKSYPALGFNEYSEIMRDIISIEQKLDFLHWRNPSVFAQQLSQLLNFLQRKS